MSSETESLKPWRLPKIAAYLKASSAFTYLAAGLALLALISGFLTYSVLTQQSPERPDPALINRLLAVNLVIAVALAAVILLKVAKLFAERRRGSAGSRLHIRLVLLFALIAIAPTIILALFSRFVDNGLLRLNEAEEVVQMFRDHFHLQVVHVDAGERFMTALEGITDPETKRKTIGRIFVDVFDEEAHKLGEVTHLVQGTLYPDVIESVSFKGPSAVIKTHHNVGGLPEHMKLSLCEPLRELFKDEVREVGSAMGMPRHVLWRQPFPGPGLAIRCLGEVTEEKLRILREADAICDHEIRAAGLYERLWQSFCVLLPVRSVGVMGDARTYEYAIAIRAVESRDAMTADWARLPYDLLARMSNRIINEVRGCNRVTLDISSKPPATIEWE